MTMPAARIVDELLERVFSASMDDTTPAPRFILDLEARGIALVPARTEATYDLAGRLLWESAEQIDPGAPGDPQTWADLDEGTRGMWRAIAEKFQFHLECEAEKPTTDGGAEPPAVRPSTGKAEPPPGWPSDGEA